MPGAWGASSAEAADAAATNTQPIPVTTVVAKTGTVPRIIAGIGVVTSLQSVTIRPRIEGAVKEIDFVEGDTVSAGDVLVHLDPRALQATLDGARAKKGQDQALLDNARADLDRYSTLADKKVVSSQDLDGKRAAVKQLEATLDADDASISSAETELSYATIRAPIGGRTGFKTASVGSVVSQSNTDGLVTITQFDPISVVFVAPGDRFGEIQNALKTGVADVEAIATDGSKVLARGKLTLMDNIVNASNGSIRLRASFDNKAGTLWPGLPVATRLVVAIEKGVVVPDKALARGTDGLSAYVIGQDNKAAKHPVGVSVTTDGMALVTKGLADGDTIVFDGLGQIADGATVHVLGPGNVVPTADQAVAASGSAAQP
ncbi:efflux RND transporter periplasmic adaptor subunit [Mesorhizobium sp.]|uniref:efflux RND transporter periplasmic adaptor subunit n=1 Tax=Mesorhizobium sp. TaxID=1871066 RepID=UPI003BAB177E